MKLMCRASQYDGFQRQERCDRGAQVQVKDRVRVSKESLPGYPDAMRLGWILDVVEKDIGGLSYEVAVSLPNTNGTRLTLPADQIELVSRTG